MRRMRTQTISVPKLGYTLAETELATCLSRATLYRLIALGKLKTIKRGSRRLVPTDELKKFMHLAGEP